MTIRLLLIDGDAVFRDHVGVQLTRAGDFTVTALADGRTAAAAGHDAAVLDAGLAAPSAPSLCANWRAAGETFPVIVLTPPDNPAMAAAALDAGADGWLAKPLRLADLLARVRAAVRGGQRAAARRARARRRTARSRSAARRAPSRPPAPPATRRPRSRGSWRRAGSRCSHPRPLRHLRLHLRHHPGRGA